jgi:hypothetical protein
MGKNDEPGREEALAWLVRTGRTPAECVDELWGELPKGERQRVLMRVRQWVQRARASAPPPIRASPATLAVDADPTSVRPPAPTPELGRVEWLRAQLAQLLYDVEQTRARGDLRLVATLDKRLSEVRAELDDELSRTRGAVNIDRTPGAILAEVDRRATALALRREMALRRAAREALATARAAAEESA